MIFWNWKKLVIITKMSEQNNNPRFFGDSKNRGLLKFKLSLNSAGTVAACKFFNFGNADSVEVAFD